MGKGDYVMADDYQANIRAKRNGMWWDPPDDLSAISEDYGIATAGSALAITNVAYLASTGKYLIAQADSEIEAKSRLAMAMSSPDGDTDKFIVMFEGYVKNVAWAFTSGLPLFLSDTVPGGLTHTPPSGPGEFVRACGYGTETATIIYFGPSKDYGEV